MTTQFSITDVDVDLPMLGSRRLRFAEPGAIGSSSTIIIGRNGSGKSTILREIAMAFRSYFASESLRSRQGRDRIERISIEVNGEAATLNIKASVKAFHSERMTIAARGMRPRRLIALSFTPFDKFPSTDDTRRPSYPEADDPFYLYLGFKNDARNMSPRMRLLRSIDQLAFATSSPQSDQRVVDAFDAIGYAPVIKVTYVLNDLGARRVIPEREELIEQYALRALVDEPGRSGKLSYIFDFRQGRHDSDAPIDYHDLRKLARANVLRLVSVTLTRLGEGDVELLELSSGEINLLSGFLGLAAFLEDGCLILIDEPENSLHPAWQIRYVEMLEAVLSRHQGCHYIIATHSPLVVSGVANDRTRVLRLDQTPIEMGPRAVEGESPDATLLNAFSVLTAGNNFLKQLVLEALTLIETGKMSSERAKEIASFLASVHGQIPEGDPIRNLVSHVVQLILSEQ